MKDMNMQHRIKNIKKPKIKLIEPNYKFYIFLKKHFKQIMFDVLFIFQ